MHHWFPEFWWVVVGIGLAIVFFNRRNGPP